jgi:glucose-1-phosphate cytidylyltransferase
MLSYFEEKENAVACFAGVAPTSSFSLVTIEDGGRVRTIRHVKDAGMRINGGYFVFRRQLFDYIQEGEELVQEPFQRIAAKGSSMRTLMMGSGAWTFKERQMLRTCTPAGDGEIWRPSRKQNK